MRYIVLLMITFVFGCNNQNLRLKKEQLCEQLKVEEFQIFYEKFYADSTYQKERILTPLKGTIKVWENDTVKKESWGGKNVKVTSIIAKTFCTTF